MKIKSLPQTLRPVDISEWNDEAAAFVKPLNGFEQLVLNDLFLSFYNKDNDAETRFDAGFRAAVLCLVDKDGEPLLVDSDRAAISAASYLPLFRMFSAAINTADGDPLETAKKN